MKRILLLVAIFGLCMTWITTITTTAVETDIRPVGDTSRKSPLLIGQKVITEVNMYDEYMYSHTIEYKGFTRDKDSLRIDLFLEIGKCSDGLDRDINIWNTDFELFDSEYAQIGMAKQVKTMKTMEDSSWNILMFPETSSDTVIMFDRVPEGVLYLRFNPMNSYRLDDKNNAKSAVWFTIEP